MEKARGPKRPRRSVRLRFTILYAGVFLASGIVLLVLTNLLAGGKVSAPGPPTQAQRTDLPAAQELIHGLRAQLAQAQTAQSRRLLAGSLIALAVMAVISVVLGRLVAGRVLRPLRTITGLTRRISAENLHQRLAVPGPADEVKDLADTIDGLLERLESSFAAQRRFVADASHELRTPLATMRASLDVAVAKPRPSAQTVALADRLGAELDRADRLLEGLLVLARAQHGALEDEAPVPVRELVSAALTARIDRIAAKALTVDDRGLRDATPAWGNPTLLAHMVDNLIENAITHNSEGGWIRVATNDEHGTAALVVETGGAVFDQDNVDRLTKPFQRLAADRTGSEHGSGLGLSIVSAISRAHGGRLGLYARPEGGLRVVVSLPLTSERVPV
ncbi:sensor histidine kinase [Amycolatopsis pigmentata]|uniref:histidine kinase n=1 Tax=Amycolatopsis pigmentata TaxID=450801 RepID=A0ABW5G0X2_9PSEU